MERGKGGRGKSGQLQDRHWVLPALPSWNVFLARMRMIKLHSAATLSNETLNTL